MGYADSPLSYGYAKYLSLSAWFRLPSPAISHVTQLVTIYDNALTNFYFTLVLHPVGSTVIFKNFPNGAVQVYAGGDPYGFSVSGSNSVAFMPVGLPTALAPDAWYHIALAVDTFHASTYSTPPDYKICKIVLNATTLTGGTDTDFASTVVPQSAAYREYFDGGVLAPWQMNLNGTISVPYVPFQDARNPGFTDPSVAPAICYGDVQIWFGQFIDPTDAGNYSNFVNISGGKGTPQKPSVAAAAFGKQSILLTGKASQFIANQGSLGGSFTKYGTLNDFTPTASY